VYTHPTQATWNTDKPRSGPVGRPGPRVSSLPRPGRARDGLGVNSPRCCGETIKNSHSRCSIFSSRSRPRRPWAESMHVEKELCMVGSVNSICHKGETTRTSLRQGPHVLGVQAHESWMKRSRVLMQQSRTNLPREETLVGWTRKRSIMSRGRGENLGR